MPQSHLSSVLREFAELIMGDFSIEQVLDRLVERVAEVVPVFAAAITLTDADGRRAHVAKSSKLSRHADADVDIDASVVLSLPLRDRRGPRGTLDLYDKGSDGITFQQTEDAQALADLAAICIECAACRSVAGDAGQHKERLAAIVESSTDAIIGRNLAGEIVTWNHAAERLYGYTSDEAMGRALSLIVPPESIPATVALQAAAARGELVGTVEAKRIARDGSALVVEISVSPVLGPEGTVIGTSMVSRDVSERNYAIAALRRSEARHRAILESSMDAVITMNHEGRIDGFSPAAERLFGHAEADVTGLALSDVIIPPARRDEHRGELAEYLATKQGRLARSTGESTLLRADGSEFPVDISIYAIDSPDGPFFTGFVRDLTQWKAADAARRALEEQNNQRQRLESLGQLAGGVAHDFNNLLSVIISYASFVARATPDQPDVQSDIARIVSASKRAVALTKQLLTFARREPLAAEVLDLNTVVDEVHELLDHTLGEQVQLVINRAQGLRPVLADRGQMEQVILNCAINARDAMSDGGTLTVETANADRSDIEASGAIAVPPDGEWIRLTVSDTGDGMSAEIAARAFDPFFTTKSAGEGSGLGLATVYGIVTDAGGYAEIDSEEGRGTTITVYLPATSGAPNTATPRVAGAPVLGAGEAVLVVEDQDAVREITARILRANGYTALEASTGEEALALFADHPVDLVLTDVVMPRMSGRQLVERLRRLRPTVAVLYMSGYARGVFADEDEGEARWLIHKPFSEADLLHRVNEALRSAGASKARDTVR